MIYDSIAYHADTVNRLTVVNGVFGEQSVVYHNVAEIAYPLINPSTHIVMSIIATVLCIGFLLILLTLKGRIANVVKMVLDYRFTKKQYDEASRIGAMNTSHITLFTVSVVAVQIWLMTDHPEYRITGVVFLALLGVILLQSAALKIIAWICKSDDLLGEIALNRKLYADMVGAAVLPVTVVALLYNETEVEHIALYVSKILFTILIIATIARLLKVFGTAQVSYFFRFLYLCAFEISPYLALLIIFENID
jgi:hypothetical protein